MLSTRLVRTAAVCAVLAAGATACGSEGKPAAKAPAAPAPASASPSPVQTLDTEKLTAEELSKQAHAAMSALTALKVDGSLTSEGQKITLHLAADKQGNCKGTVSVGDGQVEVVHNGTGTWIKPDAAFWKKIGSEKGNPKAGAMAAELFKGRYLTGGQSDSRIQEVASMCDLIKGITQDNDEGPLTKGAAGTVNGVKTFTLLGTDPEDGAKTTLHIATEGKPYLIRMEAAGKEPGQMDFSDFDKPVTVQAPPADEVIDYSLFQQKLKTA
ncbi:hypothetical protein BX265_5343 [Streptomyces sp. TLI_235]|nr:hypothetical protein [Streptomyces sp. TLI_235]PBC70786.1 hypothetical protein BX265_5343 [Streptomyces sp. TLI_235]